MRHTNHLILGRMIMMINDSSNRRIIDLLRHFQVGSLATGMDNTVSFLFAGTSFFDSSKVGRGNIANVPAILNVLKGNSNGMLCNILGRLVTNWIAFALHYGLGIPPYLAFAMSTNMVILGTSLEIQRRRPNYR